MSAKVDPRDPRIGRTFTIVSGKGQGRYKAKVTVVAGIDAKHVRVRVNNIPECGSAANIHRGDNLDVTAPNNL